MGHSHDRRAQRRRRIERINALGDVRAGALTDKGSIYAMSKSKEVSLALVKLAIEKIHAR
jgi:hypothetical protein